MLPGIAFAIAFFIYIIVGIICVLTPPVTKVSVASVPIPSSATCMRAARTANYVAAELNIGSPARRRRLLVRWDKVVASPTLSMHLFDARIIESKSLECDGVNTTCADTVLVNSGETNKGFRRKVAKFDYTTRAVELAKYDVAGYMLGMDGELYMVRGYRYWMTATHVCYAETSDAAPTVTLGALRATVSSGGAVIATASALAHVSAALLGGSYAREATVKFICDNTTLGGVGTVAVLPHIAGYEQAYLAMSDAHLYEIEPTKVSVRRRIVELGQTCAAALTDYERDYNLYLLDCNNAQAVCATTASLPFRRIATLDMVVHYDANGTVVFHFELSPTMRTLPNLTDSTDATSLALVKLLLIMMSAALVWVRSDRVTSKPHWLYRHCIQAAHCVPIPDMSTSSVIEDASMGLFAIIARFAVAMWRYDTLQHDSQTRVCIVEIVASALSCAHWLARYWIIDPWLPYLVGGKPDGRGPLTRLGGSSAIVDTSSGVLLAFSEAPLLVSALPRFEPTARLLIGLLISMVALPRCLFSSACCAILYESGQVGRSRVDPEFALLLILSSIFWIFQLVALAISINDLVVTPLGYSIGRGLVGGTGWISVAISMGFVTAGVPRLLNSSVRLGLSHARKQ